MSPLARRGRLILWVLLAILLLDEWGSYVITISRKGFGDVGFRNHAMVLLVSYFAFDLARNGELLGRFLLAVVASVRAYLNFRLAFVLWRGAEALHQDNAIKQAGMTREGVMLMVSSLGTAGLVKVFAVQALFFVPSIRVFLAYQKMKTRLRYEPTPSNVIVALSKHNRPRDDELTFDLLRALDPAKRYDFISEYVYCLDDQELEQAPPALRMVSAVNELATYVGSGGFHNYYSTTGGCRIEMAVAGLARIAHCGVGCGLLFARGDCFLRGAGECWLSSGGAVGFGRILGDWWGSGARSARTFSGDTGFLPVSGSDGALSLFDE